MKDLEFNTFKIFNKYTDLSTDQSANVIATAKRRTTDSKLIVFIIPT